MTCMVTGVKVVAARVEYIRDVWCFFLACMGIVFELKVHLNSIIDIKFNGI